MVNANLNPTAAIARSIGLAEASDAELHLSMPIFDSRIDAATGYLNVDQITTLRRQFAEPFDEKLAQYCNVLASQGVRAVGHAAWGKHAHEAIIDSVLALSPDLVITELSRDDFAHRWSVIKSSDWRLVRLCPSPLMLVQPGSPPLPQKICAAVDPQHSERRRAPELDERVLEQARILAGTVKKPLEVAHVFPHESGDAKLSTLVDEIVVQLQEADRHGFHQFANEQQVPPEHRILLRGDPVPTMIHYADANEVDVLVIGSQYRTGVGRLYLGSNAESLIARCNCDVLLVRPDGFFDEIKTQHSKD